MTTRTSLRPRTVFDGRRKGTQAHQNHRCGFYKRRFSSRIIHFPRPGLIAPAISPNRGCPRITLTKASPAMFPVVSLYYIGFRFWSFPCPTSIHTGCQVTTVGQSVLLELTGPPRGKAVNPANGSDALEGIIGP